MYKDLASTLFFTKTTGASMPEVLVKHGLQYRKGKDFADLVYARQKALKQGQAKIETELGFFEIYLKIILKPIKKVK